jgi:hypothetical protein
VASSPATSCRAGGRHQQQSTQKAGAIGGATADEGVREAIATTAPAQPAGPSATVSADATNQNFRLNNRSENTVTHVYVSRVSDEEWGADVLGSQVIPAGEHRADNVSAGESDCNWDVRVTVNNETNHELRNLNLCQTSEVNYD